MLGTPVSLEFIDSLLREKSQVSAQDRGRSADSFVNVLAG